MVWIEYESFRFICPYFAGVFVWGEALQGFEPAAIIVGVDEVVEVCGQLGMAIVMVSFGGRIHDRPVHPFDLAIGSGVLDPGQPVFDLMFVADPVEDVVEGVFVVRHVGELDASLQ